MRTVMLASLALALATSLAQAQPSPHPQADAQALDLAEKAIALRSVRGPGNQTPQVAALYRSALVAGGFADGRRHHHAGGRHRLSDRPLAAAPTRG